MSTLVARYSSRTKLIPAYKTFATKTTQAASYVSHQGRGPPFRPSQPRRVWSISAAQDAVGKPFSFSSVSGPIFTLKFECLHSTLRNAVIKGSYSLQY